MLLCRFMSSFVPTLRGNGLPTIYFKYINNIT